MAYIGFPETSLDKWMPEGSELVEIEEKHMDVRLPDVMLSEDSLDVLDATYLAWKDAIPLNDQNPVKASLVSKAEEYDMETFLVWLASELGNFSDHEKGRDIFRETITY